MLIKLLVNKSEIVPSILFEGNCDMNSVAICQANYGGYGVD